MIGEASRCSDASSSSDKCTLFHPPERATNRHGQVLSGLPRVRNCTDSKLPAEQDGKDEFKKSESGTKQNRMNGFVFITPVNSRKHFSPGWRKRGSVCGNIAAYKHTPGSCFGPGENFSVANCQPTCASPNIKNRHIQHSVVSAIVNKGIIIIPSATQRPDAHSMGSNSGHP